MINLLLLNHFYPVISYRRGQKENDELSYTVWWSLVMVRNQLPVQVVKSRLIETRKYSSECEYFSMFRHYLCYYIVILLYEEMLLLCFFAFQMFLFKRKKKKIKRFLQYLQNIIFVSSTVHFELLKPQLLQACIANNFN